MRLLKSIIGPIIGLLELVGLKYPVKHYAFRVSPILWRGSRLDSLDKYRALKRDGVRLIVNLCAEPNKIADDAEECKQFGFKYARIRIIDNTAPTIKQVREFIRLVKDVSNQPVFVHCEAGRGRTGVMVACYRIAVENWNVDDAIVEAKGFGLVILTQEHLIRRFAVKLGRVD
jgi:protein-tyrosine phosphatase